MRTRFLTLCHERVSFLSAIINKGLVKNMIIFKTYLGYQESKETSMECRTHVFSAALTTPKNILSKKEKKK